MFHLFPDQKDLVTRVRSAMPRHRWVLMQAATGAGKTRMSLDMIHGAVSKGKRAIFTVPRRELLAQTVETVAGFNIPFGVIGPKGYPVNPLAPVQIAMTPTLARRLDRTQLPDVMFLDECHFGGAELETVIAWAKASGAYGVGMSATPMKNNGRGMGDWYAHMECGLPVADLMRLGRLSDYRYFGPSAPDLSSVPVSSAAGDYAPKALATFMEADAAIIGDATKTYRQFMQGKRTVLFATSRKHAARIQDAFQAAGIAAQAIDGTMDAETRKRIIMGFARREFGVLINVDLLTFGFDLSQAVKMPVRVEALIDLCPVKSLPKQMQKWGRGLRAGDEPCVIADHVNNWREHGFPDSEREWTLTTTKRRGSQGERVEPVRQCPIGDGGCGFVHRPSPACPNCGFEYPVQSRTVDEVDGELQEIDREAAERARIAARQEQDRADSLDALLEIAKRTGKNPRWAHHVWQARQRKRATA